MGGENYCGRGKGGDEMFVIVAASAYRAVAGGPFLPGTADFPN